MTRRAKQQFFKVKIPKGYTKAQRQAISQEIINQVIERTQKGKDKSGKSFPGYSKEYKQSDNFKLAGKGSTVDLTLTEEMLGSLKQVKDKDGEVGIGYDGRSSKLNGKVEGNIKGTYGQLRKPLSKRKPRDFLGISDKELQKILKQYPLEDKQALREKTAEMEALQAFAANLLRRAGDETE